MVCNAVQGICYNFYDIINIRLLKRKFLSIQHKSCTFLTGTLWWKKSCHDPKSYRLAPFQEHSIAFIQEPVLDVIFIQQICFRRIRHRISGMLISDRLCPWFSLGLARNMKCHSIHPLLLSFHGIAINNHLSHGILHNQ